MPALHYTIWSFIPNPSSSADGYDFAVFVVGKDAGALAGICLSSYGLSSSDPITQSIIDDTMKVIQDRIAAACADPNAKTGLDLLSHVMRRSVSSLVCHPAKSIPVREYDRAMVAQLADKIFRTRIVPAIARRHRERYRSIDWRNYWTDLVGPDITVQLRGLTLPHARGSRVPEMGAGRTQGREAIEPSCA